MRGVKHRPVYGATPKSCPHLDIHQNKKNNKTDKLQAACPWLSDYRVQEPPKLPRKYLQCRFSTVTQVNLSRGMILDGSRVNISDEPPNNVEMYAVSLMGLGYLLTTKSDYGDQEVNGVQTKAGEQKSVSQNGRRKPKLPLPSLQSQSHKEGPVNSGRLESPLVQWV